MRYFFEISYHGARYNGWQSQPNAVGIQAVVEGCMTKILREPVAIVGSGRTDTGVHCKQQFFHADVQNLLSDDFLYKINAILPKDIVIHTCRNVIPEANARYDALDRSYEYYICQEKNAFNQGQVWFFHKPLDIQTMNEAAALLVGKNDFECFSKVKTDVNNFLCEIKSAYWTSEVSILCFHITANRFLRGMVRAIVGTLVDVGLGKTTLDEFRMIIESRNRREAGANVPPEGLFLVKVTYPEEVFLHSK